MLKPQYILPIAPELVVDLFAGGGGASTGIELAIGRHVDIAINHDPEAVALHQANHPQTRHFVSDVFEVDPVVVTDGQPVGLLWASPDCKHFSKAKGGKPVSKKIRSLAGVVIKWVKALKPTNRHPRVICLENVEEFQTWGPLIKRKFITTDAEGNAIEQWGEFPCPDRKGQTFKRWVSTLRNLGYAVEWRELRACDYGAPTIRKRLFLVARRDGQPIAWPEPTHGAPGSLPVRQRKLKLWRTAAECIDWSIHCPSIFERTKPLADATCRRIAKGIMRYVVDAAEPFIVENHSFEGAWLRGESQNGNADWTRAGTGVNSPIRPRYTSRKAASGAAGSNPAAPSPYNFFAPSENAGEPLAASEPLGAVENQACAEQAPSEMPGSTALSAPIQFIAPTLVQTGYGERDGQSPRALDIDKPLGTVVASQKHALVSAFLAKHYTGVVGSAMADPLGTVTTVDHHSLVTAHITKFRTNSTGSAADEPLHTVTAGGETARPSTGNVMGLVTANMIHLGHGEGKDGTKRFSHGIRSLTDPLNTITATGAPGAIVTSHLAKLRGTSSVSATSEPLHTVSAQGTHHAEVRAFLIKYYGTDQDPRLTEPMHTIPTRDRFGLVTVHGEEYAIVDIGLRMLTPRELYRAQGFPESYQIEHRADGRPLTKTAQVRMCGNSVCPPLSQAIVAANYAEPGLMRRAA